MDGSKSGFSYNAYIHVGHYEKPVAVVDARMGRTPDRPAADDSRSRDPRVVSGHVGCLAAIMMFRLDVRHPIGLKKFEIPRENTIPTEFDQDNRQTGDIPADEISAEEREEVVNSNSGFGECLVCANNNEFSKSDSEVKDKSQMNVAGVREEDEEVFHNVSTVDCRETARPPHHWYNVYSKLGRHLSQDVSQKVQHTLLGEKQFSFPCLPFVRTADNSNVADTTCMQEALLNLKVGS